MEKITQQFELDASDYLRESDRVATKNAKLGGSFENLGRSAMKADTQTGKLPSTLRKSNRSTKDASLLTNKFSSSAKGAAGSTKSLVSSALSLASKLPAPFAIAATAIAFAASNLRDFEAEFQFFIETTDRLKDFQFTEIGSEFAKEASALKSIGGELDFNIKKRRESLSLTKSAAREAERAATKAAKALKEGKASSSDRAFTTSISETGFFKSRSLSQRAAKLAREGSFDRADKVAESAAEVAKELKDSNLLRSSKNLVLKLDRQRIAALTKTNDEAQKLAKTLRSQADSGKAELDLLKQRQQQNSFRESEVKFTEDIKKNQITITTEITKSTAALGKQLGEIGKLGFGFRFLKDSLLEPRLIVEQEQEQELENLFKRVDSFSRLFEAKGGDVDLSRLTSLSSDLDEFSRDSLNLFTPFEENLRLSLDALRRSAEASTSLGTSSASAADAAYLPRASPII